MRSMLILCLLALVPFVTANADEPVTAEVHLASSPARAFAAARGRPLKISEYQASKFRLVPGLVYNKTGIFSLELVGAKNFFLRHQEGIIKIHERPKKINLLFDGDSSWKVIKLSDDKVRFESVNYPGDFITVREDGNVVKLRNPPLENSTFKMTPR